MKESFSTIDEVRNFLNRIPKFSTDGQSAANFNLDRMRELCDRMGNPQDNFPSIHVAGTNGKGTVCRLLSSIYQNAGYKTALYTSPHLERVEERFRVNTTEISEKELIQFFQSYGDSLIAGGYTFFEITTAIAFWHFSAQNIDLAIIETGLGGRLDATNILKPIATIITSVGIDHADILGNTLEAIATEKGGIIKQKTPVFIGKLKKAASDVIHQISKDAGSELIKINNDRFEYKNGTIHIVEGNNSIKMYSNSFKKIDACNVQLCRNVVKYLETKYPVTRNEFSDGVEKMDKLYPKRAVFERLSDHLNWYFDGAHNTEATKHLINHVKQIAPISSWNVVLSFMGDKLNNEIAKSWSEFDSIFVYEMHYSRAAKIEDMLNYFPNAKVIDEANLINLTDLKSELVIFSGSFYFYTVARTWLGTLNAS